MARKSSATSADPVDPREPVTARLIELLQALIADGVLRNELIARELGLNLVDLQSLGLIMRRVVTTPGELAARSGLPTSTATRILDRLEARDLVRREADAGDRRKVRVVMARSPFEGMSEDPYAGIVDNLRVVHSGFTPDELEIVARYLAALTTGPDGSGHPADTAPTDPPAPGSR